MSFAQLEEAARASIENEENNQSFEVSKKGAGKKDGSKKPPLKQA